MMATQSGSNSTTPTVGARSRELRELPPASQAEHVEEEAYYPIEEFYDQDPEDEPGTP